MKVGNLLIIPLATALLLNCKKDDDSKPSTTNSPVEGNTYTITYYYDKDHEETADYAGYEFAFKANNVLTASKSGAITTGTWALHNDDSHKHFIIALGTAEPLSELNDDWEVVESSATIVKLKDESGSGGTESLTFTKK